MGITIQRSTSQITGVRFENDIDIFVTLPNSELRHYWANPSTAFTYNEEILFNGAISKPSVTRFGNNIDVYFISTGDRLIQLWAGENTGWEYQTRLLKEGNVAEPFAVRWENNIDVFCFNDAGVLHFYTSDQHNWEYQSRQLSTNGGRASNLVALRICENHVDVFFVCENKLIHIYFGTYSNWEIINETLIEEQFVSDDVLCAVRCDHSVSVFYSNGAEIRQVLCAESTNWVYTDVGNVPGFNGQNHISAVQYEDHIDIYQADVGAILHSYKGPFSNFNWTSVENIAQGSEYKSGGIFALRPFEKAIDVYFLGNEDKLEHLYIGEGTNNTWDFYESDLSLPIEHYEDDYLGGADTVGEGYHSIVLRSNKDDGIWVYKKFKQYNPEVVKKEVRLWQAAKLNSISALLYENNQLMGYKMIFLPGQNLSKYMVEKETIHFHDLEARWRLIKEIGLEIQGLQSKGICHADLSLDNVLIQHINDDKFSKRYFLNIIDFSNGMFFNQNTQTNQCLTGWACLVPPEARNGAWYNPSGVNAYQFGRLAMQILLYTKYERYPSISSSPDKELKKLKRKGTTKKLRQYLKDITSDNPGLRKARFDDFLLIKRAFIKDAKIHDVSNIKKNKYDFYINVQGTKINGYDALREIATWAQANPKSEWSDCLASTGNHQFFWASSSLSIEGDAFFVVTLELKSGVYRILNDTGNPSTTVKLEFFSTVFRAKFGSYNGFELYFAFVEGQIAYFDVRLALGVSEGSGISVTPTKSKEAVADFWWAGKLGYHFCVLNLHLISNAYLPKSNGKKSKRSWFQL